MTTLEIEYIEEDRPIRAVCWTTAAGSVTYRATMWGTGRMVVVRNGCIMAQVDPDDGSPVLEALLKMARQGVK